MFYTFFNIFSAFIPIWLFTLGKHIFDRGNLQVPYSKIATYAIGLLIPLAIGFFIQKKMPRFCKIMVRIMKPFSVILIIFIIIFAVVTNLYLFKLFSWKVIMQLFAFLLNKATLMIVSIHLENLSLKSKTFNV